MKTALKHTILKVFLAELNTSPKYNTKQTNRDFQDTKKFKTSK